MKKRAARRWSVGTAASCLLAGMAAPAAAAPEVHCQTTAFVYGNNQADTHDTTGSACSLSSTQSGTVSTGAGSFSSTSQATMTASLAEAAFHLSASVTVVPNRASLPGLGGDAAAQGYMTDTLYISSAAAGTGTIQLLFDGSIGLGGYFGAQLLFSGGANSTNDLITYVDQAYYENSPSTVNLSPGSTYTNGVLTAPVSFGAGTTNISLLFGAYANENASFSHTVNLQLNLPDTASYTSQSGVFLTAPQDTIAPGVTDGSAVPEPTAWAMIVAGVGLLGAALRQRRMLAPA